MRHLAFLGTRTVFLLGVLVAAALVNGCGSGGGSDPDSPPVIGTPVVESLSAGDGQAEVSWSFVPGVDGYNVYWSPGSIFDADEAQVALGVLDHEYTIAGLEAGGSYTVCIAGTIGTAEGPLSAPAAIILPPGAPSVVSATSTSTVIVVEWTDVPSATSYDVYRSLSPDVSTATGERFSGVSSPFSDPAMPGTMYYYIVVAVGAGGSGRASATVAGEVEVVLGAPTNLTVAVPEEAPGSLLITWDAPLDGEPDSYNLYFSTSPDVTTADDVIEGAVSPYTHTGLLGRTSYYYRVAGVVSGVVGPLSAEASGMPRGSPGGGGSGGGGGGGGGHEEGFGNNLAVPLVFAEGYGLGGAQITGVDWQDFATGLRPLSSEGVVALPVLDPATAVEINNMTVYPQQTVSTWQADWRNGEGEVQHVIVDWGDNLRSAQITANSVVRVETVLYRDVPDDPMMAVEMVPLGGTGSDEAWGTPNGVAVVESARRHVFAPTGRLTLTKLLGEGGSPDPAVTPISLSVAEGLGEEEGSHAAPGGGGGGGSGGGGGGAPMRFGLEINVAGSGVYGFVWMLRKSGIPELDRAGWWKATFSLDATANVGSATITNNTRLDGTDASDPAAVLDSDTSCSIEFLIE